MKWLAIGLLGVGIALCAAFGARLSPEMGELMAKNGAASFRGGAEKKAFEQYCKARVEAKLAPADGCKDPEAKETPPGEKPKKKPKAAPPTAEQLISAGKQELATLRAAQPELPANVAELRTKWLSAKEAAIEPGARAATAKPPPPKGRVGSWFAVSGLPFLAGLVLVTVGAVLGRVAVRREASGGERKAGSEAGAVDFGEVLGKLHDGVRALHETLSDAKPSRDALDEVKSGIEALQLEELETLVAARTTLQVRLGMAGYAEVFGPLSAAERRLNRAWSALVDAHVPEARESVERALGELDDARRILREHERAT